MPLLAASDYQQLIIVQVGDIKTQEHPGGILAATITTLWALNEAQPTVDLRYLYTKRSAIETLLGVVKEQVTLSGNDREIDLNAKSTNLQRLIDNVDLEIKRAEANAAQQAEAAARRASAPVVGQLRTTAPVSAPAGYADGNDRRYHGDLYRR